jgi:hypothetical protein
MDAPEMRLDRRDFLRKLRQIEHSARYALDEAPPGLAAQHLKLVIGLAKYLVTEIELTR